MYVAGQPVHSNRPHSLLCIAKWSGAGHCIIVLIFLMVFFMEKVGLNHKRGHAIIDFNHGLSCYVKNMALGSCFNTAWQAMSKTYTRAHK